MVFMPGIPTGLIGSKVYVIIATIAALCTIFGFVFGAFAHPNIDKFDITPGDVFPKDDVILSWAVSNADNVYLENLESNLPFKSARVMHPTESTNYSLVATRWHFLKCRSTQEVQVWDPHVKITSPENNTSVKATATISGTISGDVPPDHHIWIVVRSARAEADRWWTQGDASIEGSPNWPMLGSFGGEQDVGAIFTIKAILVDDTVDYILAKNGKDGIRLPSRIGILDNVTVIRIAGDIVLAVTYPTNGDHVSSSSNKPVSIEGTIYGTIPKGHDIWTIHSPSDSARWYPDGIIERIAPNTWKRDVYLTDPPEKEYDIKAVLVDNETSIKYRNDLETKAYKGFPASEEEGRVKVLASIHLTKVSN